jgi:2-haloacid dehalogenase
LGLVQMKLAGVRAIVFDVFGTVVDWRGGVADQAAPFLERYAVRPESDAIIPIAFADAWRRQYLAVMPDVRSGKRPFTRLDVLHRETLETALAEFGIKPDQVPEPELQRLTFAWHRLPPWPDAAAGLARLKKGYIIAPHSNGNILLLTEMAKNAGLPWDVILGAEVVRVYKQAPESYLRTADILGMRPDEICLVSAHNSDLGSARRCGMRTCFVPRPAERGPGQTTDLAPEQDWDLVAADFGELAGAMGV